MAAPFSSFLSVVASNVAFLVVFDEATDTDSEDDAEFSPSVHLSTGPDRSVYVSTR